MMMLAKGIPLHFWAEALNTACHIHNRVTIRPGTTVTHYEIWRVRKPNVKYFHVFGSVCYILADRDHRRKFDPKSDEGIFLGYSRSSRAYRVFNKHTKTMMESINVVVNDVPDDSKSADNEDDVLPSSTNVRINVGDKVDDIVHEQECFPEEAESSPKRRVPSRRVRRNHPVKEVIGDIGDGMRTRSKTLINYREMIGNLCFVSKIVPKNVNEAIDDEYWISAMQEELVQFERNEV